MGAPRVTPLCRETSVSRTANVGTVGKNKLNGCQAVRVPGADREGGDGEPRFPQLPAPERVCGGGHHGTAA